jgi:hypothetical protein
MKIVEQYVTAVGYKLPFKRRKDIQNELRSLILDQIEDQYGTEADEEAAIKVIESFGSPSKVAAEYSDVKVPISQGFTELYYLLLAIVAGGLSIAFATIFFIDLIQNNPSGLDLFYAIMNIPVRVIGTWFPAVGWITIVFMLISRFGREKLIQNDWTVKDLQGIDVGVESKISSYISMTFLAITALLVIVFPGIMTALEELFLVSTLELGNRIDISRFSWYAYAIAAVWSVEIYYHILLIKNGGDTKAVKGFAAFLALLTAMLFGIMILDSGLYTFQNNWIGFRLVFLIVFLVSTIEAITYGVKRLIQR